MRPASLSVRPSLWVRPSALVTWLSLLGFLLAYISDQSVRSSIGLLLQIIWLYFATGARG